MNHKVGVISQRGNYGGLHPLYRLHYPKIMVNVNFLSEEQVCGYARSARDDIEWAIHVWSQDSEPYPTFTIASIASC